MSAVFLVYIECSELQEKLYMTIRELVSIQHLLYQYYLRELQRAHLGHTGTTYESSLGR